MGTPWARGKSPVDNAMQLEIIHRGWSVGFTKEAWPLTRHYIVRLGKTEARVIVPKDRPDVSALAVIALLASGLILGK